MPEDKIYLGDGAYAQVDRDRASIALTTENGIRVQNTVVLGADELRAFLDWLQAQGIIRWSMQADEDEGARQS